MPNSATLAQTILAAFCAILCATALPQIESGNSIVNLKLQPQPLKMGGGGMMIGARTAAWAKSGGWRPYLKALTPLAYIITDVDVGTGTDFNDAGVKIEVEYEIDDDVDTTLAQNFLCCRRVILGYSWHYLSPEDVTSKGVHTAVFTCQASSGVKYKILIDGSPSVEEYTTYYAYGAAAPFGIGTCGSSRPYCFGGKLFAWRLYKADGTLGYEFLPHPSGGVINVQTGVVSSNAGNFAYHAG